MKIAEASDGTSSFGNALTAVIITGGSSGIGASLITAIKNLTRDVAVCNLSRRNPNDFLSIDRLTHFSVNLAIRAETDLAVENVRKFLREEVPSGPLLLVNNAGFGSYGDFSDQDPERQIDMAEVNMRAPVQITGGIMPDLLARGGGVLNVASTAAFQPTPSMATYGATKSFLMHWSLGLAEELKDSPVRVTCLCPGPTETEFFRAAGIQKSNDDRAIPFSQTADEVARTALAALEKRKPLVVSGGTNKLLVGASQCLPRTWTAKMAAAAMKQFRPGSSPQT